MVVSGQSTQPSDAHADGSPEISIVPPPPLGLPRQVRTTSGHEWHNAAPAHPAQGPVDVASSGTPGRRVVVAWLAAAAFAGALTGAGIAILRPLDDATRELSAQSPATSGAGATTGSGASVAGPAASPDISGASLRPSPSITLYVTKPWGTSLLEPARIYSVTQAPDGRVQVLADRLTALTGAQAKEWFAKHPELEPGPVALVNHNERRYTLNITADAPLFASTLVGRQGTPTAVDSVALVNGLNAALARQDSVLVWIQNTKVDNGVITYLAEYVEP